VEGKTESINGHGGGTSSNWHCTSADLTVTSQLRMSFRQEYWANIPPDRYNLENQKATLSNIVIQ